MSARHDITLQRETVSTPFFLALLYPRSFIHSLTLCKTKIMITEYTLMTYCYDYYYYYYYYSEIHRVHVIRSACRLSSTDPDTPHVGNLRGNVIMKTNLPKCPPNVSFRYMRKRRMKKGVAIKTKFYTYMRGRGSEVAHRKSPEGCGRIIPRNLSPILPDTRGNTSIQ